MYLNYVFSSDVLSAIMMIPNNVDDTYTGVIFLNATLSLYEGTADEESFPHVVPLTRGPRTNLFASNDGNNSVRFDVTLPDTLQQGLLQRIVVELYASNHGCEEFYYANAPDANATQYGVCGGGSYRELQVFVDGDLAGAVVPFPVIYTGGINPLLWRPISGIMSFDIPSHKFDVTPYLGSFVHSQQSNTSLSISIKVIGQGDSRLDYWLMDAALLVYSSPGSLLRVVSGQVTSLTHTVSATDREYAVDASDSIGFFSSRTHKYEVNGTVTLSDGSSRQYSVRSAMWTRNSNSFSDTGWDITSQVYQSDYQVYSQNSDSSFELGTYSFHHSLFIADLYEEDDDSFKLNAAIQYNFEAFISTHVVTVADKGEVGSEIFSPMSSRWRSGVDSQASYNRSVSSGAVYSTASVSNAYFNIQMPDGLDCYNRHATSLNGEVNLDTVLGTCPVVTGDYLLHFFSDYSISGE